MAISSTVTPCSEDWFPFSILTSTGCVLITEGGHAVLVWSYSLESGGSDALLDEINVWDRGRGIGTALLEQVFVEMWDRDINRIFLEIEAGNHRARAFYARSGFRVENSVWM